MSIEEKVLKALQTSGEPMKSGDIAKLLNIDSKEVSKAIKKLKAEGKIESPKRCFYQVKQLI